MRWDVFCRVIDNYGDIGVCWRLAADLGARGQAVRLWVDDPAALAWMAPHGAPGVELVPWTEPAPPMSPGDVVVEAFGCDPPAEFVARMATSRTPPVWVNLEYLSAESYVERSHGLPSPQMSGPGRGLIKHFFYPGFTPATGGLLREPQLMAERIAFDRDAWLAQHGWARHANERVVLLFCYPGAPVAALLEHLADAPTLLLLAPGPAQALAESALAARPRPNLRAIRLPWLPQPEFDRALWSADLNVVRGEDSFVRAQWAAAPFIWHIYPQADGAHVEKLNAFLLRLGLHAPVEVQAQVAAVWHAFNGTGSWPQQWPHPVAWGDACRQWRTHLLNQRDLSSQLLQFVATKALG